MGSYKFHELLTKDSIDALMPEIIEKALALGYHYDDKGVFDHRRGWISLEDFEQGPALLAELARMIWLTLWPNAQPQEGLPAPFTHAYRRYEPVTGILRRQVGELFTNDQLLVLSGQVSGALRGNKLAAYHKHHGIWMLRDWPDSRNVLFKNHSRDQGYKYWSMKVDAWREEGRIKEEAAKPEARVILSYDRHMVKWPQIPNVITKDSIVEWMRKMHTAADHALEVRDKNIATLHQTIDELEAKINSLDEVQVHAEEIRSAARNFWPFEK